jgi:hypothetical protein
MELLFSVVMDKVRIKIKTVPAFDPLINKEHTAYTVSYEGNGAFLCYAAGWTLRDAIDSLCQQFGVERHLINLVRPFLPQRWDDNEAMSDLELR